MTEASLVDSDVNAAIRISTLMGNYARCLDNRNLSAWAKLFMPQAKYFVASVENVNAGFPLLLINDDTKSKIEDRVRYVEQFWEGSYNDYLPRHVLSMPLLLDVQDERLEFEQSFALYMTENDAGSEQMGASAVLCVGSYRGMAGFHSGQLKINELGAYLDTGSLERSLVYPV